MPNTKNGLAPHAAVPGYNAICIRLLLMRQSVLRILNAAAVLPFGFSIFPPTLSPKEPRSAPTAPPCPHHSLLWQSGSDPLPSKTAAENLPAPKTGFEPGVPVRPLHPNTDEPAGRFSKSVKAFPPLQKSLQAIPDTALPSAAGSALPPAIR